MGEQIMELKELTIKDLLSNYKLVIPEIQREYVWGSNKSVLEKFLSELNTSLLESKYSEPLGIENQNNIRDLKKNLENALTKVNNLYETNIGFLYSYDAGNDEHYIIDGQQRLTTIVLLLYFYSVKEGKKSDFKNLLNTSGTFMNFSYRVRPLTEQFLINLFNDENITEESFKNLKDSKWYVSDYDGDTTISSICKLYKWVSDKDNTNRFPNLNYDSLLNRVKFYYFDVQQTSQGEELYITMNSRGEQLKDNEQIKPYILENVRKKNGNTENYAKEWENWEEYFFKLRGENSVESIDTAIENIIKIALELETCGEHDKINAAEDSKVISFENIKNVYEKIAELAEPIESNNDEIKSLEAEIKNLEIENFLFSKDRKGKERNLFALEAIIRMLQFGYKLENEVDAKNIHRMLRLIRNSLNYGVMDHVPLLQFLVSLGKSENIYKFIYEKLKENPTVVEGVFVKVSDKEELYKIQAIVDGKVQEKEIEEAESLPVFNGKIHVLCRDSNTVEPNWDTFHTKLLSLKNYLASSTEKVFKSEHHVEFISNFVNSFINWKQLYKGIFGKTLFSNKDFKVWESLLKDNKFIIPLSNILLTKKNTTAWIDDENTERLWMELKDNIALIIEQMPDGRIDWNNKYYKFVLQGNGKMLIFDWKDFHRNSILQSVGIYGCEKIGNLFIGADVQFSYNDKEYVWTWQNEIKCGSEVYKITSDKDAKDFFNL